LVDLASAEFTRMTMKHYSLKDLAIQIVGKEIEKLEQMSDWNARPLRQSQLEYAAIDASVLVQIHHKLEKELDKQPRVETLDELSRLTLSEVQLEKQSGPIEFNPVARLEKSMLELQKFPDSMYKVVEIKGDQDAAQQLGLQTSQSILKSIVYIGSDSFPLIAVVSGNDFVDETKLRLVASEKYTEIKNVRKATEIELLSAMGFIRGTVGPIGAGRVFIDENALGIAPVFVGVGSLNHILQSSNLINLLPSGHVCKIRKAVQNSNGLQEPLIITCQRFLVDNMLGKVGKMLRMAGVDCLLMDDLPEGLTNFENSVQMDKRDLLKQRYQELSGIQEYVEKEDRIFLTTDTKASACCRMYRLAHGSKVAQFRDICGRFQIELLRKDFLARCVKCNSFGFDNIEKQEIRELKLQDSRFDYVPLEVLDKMHVFYICRNSKCLTLFWEGPKFDKCCSDFAFLYP